MKKVKHEIIILIWGEIREPIINQSLCINGKLSDHVYNHTWDVMEKSAVESVHQNIRL